MEITPDNIIYWQWNGVHLNATIVFTWLVMTVLVFVAWLATRNLVKKPGTNRWQTALEVVISYIREQIKEITRQEPDQFISFLGSLFLFISISNLMDIIPGFHPPTGSLSTTTALAICIFFAIPIYGISKAGFRKYLKQYLEPSILMLPFNIIGEFSRTLALAVRLFGNIMSGSLIAGILITIVPLFLPIIMQGFGLLIGQIQAYIFTILATVYIASAVQAEEELKTKRGKEGNKSYE